MPKAPGFGGSRALAPSPAAPAGVSAGSHPHISLPLRSGANLSQLPASDRGLGPRLGALKTVLVGLLSRVLGVLCARFPPFFFLVKSLQLV